MKPARNRHAWGWEFVAPATLLIAFFVIVPSLWGIGLSFTQYDGIAPPRAVGIENYARLKDDPVILSSLGATAIFVLLTLPTGLLLALGIALALHQKWFRGRHWMRAIYFLPNVTSLAAVAFVWEWLLNPEYGLINAALHSLGRPTYKWLADPDLAMPVVSGVSVWHGLGFGVLIYLAGLRSIPEEVTEAARIDGAGSWAAFRHVTWPMLTPTTMFLTIMGVIGGFQVFQSVFIMTGGGPLDRTRVYLLYLFQTSFQSLDFGYGAAMAMLLFGIILTLTLVQNRFYRRRLQTWQ
jgi:multiple sugar transport system permease protein